MSTRGSVSVLRFGDARGPPIPDREGHQQEYGARELKRTIHRHLTQPLATMVASGQIHPGALATVQRRADGTGLSIHAEGGNPVPSTREATLLVVDDNRSLLEFLEGVLSRLDCRLLLAESAGEARERAAAQPPTPPWSTTSCPTAMA